MPDELPEPSGEFLLYLTEDGRSRVECRLEDETLWLSQALMAELFDTSPHEQALWGEVENAKGKMVWQPKKDAKEIAGELVRQC